MASTAAAIPKRGAVLRSWQVVFFPTSSFDASPAWFDGVMGGGDLR
jgi:hypothetical protein